MPYSSALTLSVLSSSLISMINFSFESLTVGGRLEKEIEYTKKSIGEGYGATSELLIQTPNMEGTNILKVKEMKQHLEALTVATNISVEIFEQ